MRNKLIRVISPLSTFILFALDAIALVMTYLSVRAVVGKASFYTVCFLLIMIIVLTALILATRSIFNNGIIFYDDKLEFTALDSDNVFHYSAISRVEAHKDSAASLKKKYTERYSSLILYLNDGTVATIELGATTKKKLSLIEKEINNRIKA